MVPGDKLTSHGDTDMVFFLNCGSERRYMKITRFGVSCDKKLLNEFDSIIKNEGYENRSEAVADLMRDYILRKKIKGDAHIVGAVVVVYDHHQRELSERLLEIQHRNHTNVISTTHIHLDHHHCLEIMVLRGRAGNVQALADKLISTRGVRLGKLVVATVEEKSDV